MKVSIFSPCFVENFFPSTSSNMAIILERLGCEVEFIEGVVCCGQPAMNSGFPKEASKVFNKLIQRVSEGNYLVMPSASCCGFIRNYHSLLTIKSFNVQKIEKVISHTFEFTEFLLNILKVETITGNFQGKVAYHSSCAALREIKLGDQALSLLKKNPNLEVLEFSDSDYCCGFGGTFAVKFSDISVAMGEFKCQTISDLGVKALVSTDMSCLLQIGSILKKQNSPIRMMHLADVLV